MDHISQLISKKVYPYSGKNSKVKNFRNINILPEEEGLWKEYFIKLIQDEFYNANKEFKMTDYLRPKIKVCFDWVVGNMDVSLNKGLLLRGDVGTGKSAIMKACMKLCIKLYNGSYGFLYPIYITADKVSRLYTNRSDESERRLNQIMTTRLLFIDDIGYEAKKVFDHYPIPELIRERYDNKRITCFTTNMSMEEIKAEYGVSVEDKLNEMCTIIKFEGQSKR